MEAERVEQNDDQSANFPEYTQVKSRLLQIQDYICQTTGVMEQLKAAGTPQHMEKWLKLADMLEGLKDSEVKLTAILKTLDKFEDEQTSDVNMKPAEEVPAERESQPDQVQAAGTGDRNCLNEISKLQIRLRELQLKKAQMDQIVEQFSSLEKSIDRDEEKNNIVDDSMNGGNSAARVEEKLAELAILKTQLGQMQTLICGLGQNSSQSITIEEEKDEPSSEENVDQEQSNGYADDESLQRLKVKSMALSDAKAKLSRMKQLLTLVEDIRSLGKPVPTRVLALLNSDEGPMNNSEGSFMDMSDQSLQEICNELAATIDENQGQKNKISVVDDSSPKRHKSGEE